MNRSFSIIGLFVCLLGVLLLSSFVLLDLQTSPEPLTVKGVDWVNDHKVLTALAVSEAAGLMSKKVRGITQGILLAVKVLFKAFSFKPAKAIKK